MLKVSLRPAVPEDLDFLTHVFLVALRAPIEAARRRWDEERERAQFQHQLNLPGTQVIAVGTEKVGFVTAIPTGGAIDLHTLCIHPAYQSRGIGSMVTQGIVKSAVAAGRTVTLSVLKTNPRAQALYERLGFSVVRKSEHHAHMELRLARAGSCSEA